MECAKKWFNRQEVQREVKWPTKDLGQNEDKDEGAHVAKNRRGESTAVYFREIEYNIKSNDFKIKSVIDPK